MQFRNTSRNTTRALTFFGMVRKTRNKTCDEEQQTDIPRPSLVSLGESTRRGVAQRSHSSPNLGSKLSEEEASSHSSLDTSGDSGTAATPLLAGRSKPEVPKEVSATASLPPRVASKPRLTPSSKTKATPSSKTKSTPAKGKSSSKKTPKTPGSTPSVRSKNPLRTNSKGLERPIQEAVCQQIELNGGIVQFFKSGISNPLHKLAEECSKDNDRGGIRIWGDTGSKRRSAIRDKVLRWRDLSEEDYLRLCGQLKVTTAEVLSSQTRLFGSPDSKPAPVLLVPLPEPTTEPKPTEMESSSAGGGHGKFICFCSLAVNTPNNHCVSIIVNF